jgi:hypothetical protein
LAEWERIFSCPIPKYTESAPALIAAARLSLEPTGAIISNSSRFMRAKLHYFDEISCYNDFFSFILHDIDNALKRQITHG